MKITIELDIKPFQTPDFVIIKNKPKPRQDGMQENNTIPLSEIDAFTLHELCEEFTRSVFNKAGKHRPPQQCSG